MHICRLPKVKYHLGVAYHSVTVSYLAETFSIDAKRQLLEVKLELLALWQNPSIHSKAFSPQPQPLIT